MNNEKGRTLEQATAHQTAVFVAGQLMGLASTLNVKMLEDFLDHHADDSFRYHETCRAAIQFARVAQGGHR